MPTYSVLHLNQALHQANNSDRQFINGLTARVFNELKPLQT